MNWQVRANGIPLGMHSFVTQNAILAARFLRQKKARIKMSRLMTRKMLLIHATEVSARLARILLSRYPYFLWPNFPSIGIRSRYSCRRCVFRRFISSLFSGVLSGGRPSAACRHVPTLHQSDSRLFWCRV